MSFALRVAVLTVLAAPCLAAEPNALPGTQLLTSDEDLSRKMVDGIDRDLMRRIEQAVEQRGQLWQPDFSSIEAYEASIEGNRERLKKIIGLIDERLPPRMEQFGTVDNPALVAETEDYRVYQVRWPVLQGIHGEGLLLLPNGKPTARFVLVPDADQTPEMLVGLAPGLPNESQLARHLAAGGAVVVVPQLVNRDLEFSGNPTLEATRDKTVNMPHREWLYRMAYEMGRHIIGYEVQQVLSAIDCLEQIGDDDHERDDVAVVGYGEGGLIAFYAAAVDQRIDVCGVSGYFGSRNRVWAEPIYRNVWSLLKEFGDAEIASLILPRKLFIEYSRVPDVEGPPTRQGRREVAAPGVLTTPTLAEVQGEYDRFARGVPPQVLPETAILTGPNQTLVEPFSGITGYLHVQGLVIDPSTDPPTDLRTAFDPNERQRRLVRQIENHVQDLLQVSNHTRDAFFLNQTPFDQSAEEFEEATEEYRRIFHEELIGKIDEPLLPFNARTRQVYDEPTWTGHDVVLDVWDDVFAWGVLLLPKDLKPGERRPVVVCQHGLEGLPAEVIERESEKERAYHAFAAQLVERGFIVYAPHNPYRGWDLFRVLQRKANPLGLSLFSYIIGQHQQTLNWLKTQPFVDPERIAFYGLSYGGKTAMRVPAVVTDYCLSICSGDFNEWIWKNVSTSDRTSYMFTHEYEMAEFNLGQTFNYAEMAYLIFPRGFMVERGHRDGVGVTEWVAFEFAKVRRLYDELDKGENAEIEYFVGRHEIHGVGTFDFLHRQLDWPKRE